MPTRLRNALLLLLLAAFVLQAVAILLRAMLPFLIVLAALAIVFSTLLRRSD